jgi:hypothetical protein
MCKMKKRERERDCELVRPRLRIFIFLEIVGIRRGLAHIGWAGGADRLRARVGNIIVSREQWNDHLCCGHRSLDPFWLTCSGGVGHVGNLIQGLERFYKYIFFGFKYRNWYHDV